MHIQRSELLTGIPQSRASNSSCLAPAAWALLSKTHESFTASFSTKLTRSSVSLQQKTNKITSSFNFFFMIFRFLYTNAKVYLSISFKALLFFINKTHLRWAVSCVPRHWVLNCSAKLVRIMFRNSSSARFSPAVVRKGNGQKHLKLSSSI